MFSGKDVTCRFHAYYYTKNSLLDDYSYFMNNYIDLIDRYKLI